MDNKKEQLIKLIHELRGPDKLKIYFRLSILALLVILNPVIIARTLQKGDSVMFIFLLLSEIILLSFLYGFWNSIKESLKENENEKILNVIYNTSIVNKIIFSDHKIIFDITEDEDEVLFVKNENKLKEIQKLLSEHFGSSKILIK